MENKMTEKGQQAANIKSGFFQVLMRDFGKVDTTNIENWYEMSWEEFREELEKQNIDLGSCENRDWREFFQLEKRKLESVVNR